VLFVFGLRGYEARRTCHGSWRLWTWDGKKKEHREKRRRDPLVFVVLESRNAAPCILEVAILNNRILER
jgi:hypothetical protein